LMNEFAPSDELQAERLAAALDAVEHGEPTELHALEDPELTSLLSTAAAIRSSLDAATDTPSFHSYQARSRAFILHTLEEQGRDNQPVRGVVPFMRRHGRWFAVAPVAAAAAAAAFFFAGDPASAPPNPGDPSAGIAATNQTSQTTEIELQRIQHAIALVADQAGRGKPVDAVVLRTITEGAAAVANRIELAPQLVSKEQAATYQRTLAAGNAVLGIAQASAGSENVLVAAQRATQDGIVTAGRFLGEPGGPTATPVAVPTATASPTATSTATATPSATATATPTGTATATPTATTTPTVTPTATATGTVTPTATGTPTVTPTATPTSTVTDEPTLEP
jgi:hypothetical protein